MRPIVRMTKARVVLVGLTLLLVGLLEWSYAATISPRFAYEGYVRNPVPLWMHGVAWLCAITPSLWMPIGLTRPSQTIHWFLYALVLIPGVIIPEYILTTGTGSVLALSMTLYVSFVSLGLCYRLPPFRPARARIPRYVFWIGLGCLAMALALPVVRLFGIHLKLPGLADVYSVRAEYKLAVAGGLVAYCVSWLGRVTNPLLMAEGFAHRNPLLATLGIVGQLYLFGVTGQKGILFSAALVAGMVLVVGIGRRWFGLCVVGGLVAVILGSALADAVTHTLLFTSLFVRRVVVTPGLLTGLYFDYFRSHPPALLGHSVLSALSDYPYPLAPPRVIGAVYFFSFTNASANVWADAYANFRFGGMLGFTVILGIVLWAFDGAARGRDLRVTAALAAGFGLSLSNSALLTTVVTHGILLAIVVLLLFPRWRGATSRGIRRLRRRRVASPIAPSHAPPLSVRDWSEPGLDDRGATSA
jgi:hypothetical protein